MLDRIKESRDVTFKEDYVINGKVIYAKDHQTAIHFKTVEQLKANGAKMTVKGFNEEKMVEKKREKIEKKAK